MLSRRMYPTLMFTLVYSSTTKTWSNENVEYPQVVSPSNKLLSLFLSRFPLRSTCRIKASRGAPDIRRCTFMTSLSLPLLRRVFLESPTMGVGMCLHGQVSKFNQFRCPPPPLVKTAFTKVLIVYRTNRNARTLCSDPIKMPTS